MIINSNRIINYIGSNVYCLKGSIKTSDKMNKLLLITILLIIFTGRHENQQWMSKEKSTARKSVLEMTTRSYTAGSSVFTEILPEGSEIGLFITYGIKLFPSLFQ